MKFIYALLFALCTVLYCKAQEQESSMFDEISYPLLDKLIATAKQNYPKMKYYQVRADITKTNITKQQLSWFNSFSLSYVYQPNNTLNIVKPSFFNGYQVGVFLNFGSLLQTPTNIKVAKQESVIATNEQAEYSINLEAEVKKRYFSYVQTLAMLKIRSRAILDAEAVFKQAKYQYEKSEKTLEQYTGALSLLSQQNQLKLETETAYLMSKAALEEIIVQKLENIK